MYTRYFHPETCINNCMVSLQITSYITRPAITSVLVLGVAKAYYHNSQMQGYEKPISLIGPKRARQSKLSTPPLDGVDA